MPRCTRCSFLPKVSSLQQFTRSFDLIFKFAVRKTIKLYHKLVFCKKCFSVPLTSIPCKILEHIVASNLVSSRITQFFSLIIDMVSGKYYRAKQLAEFTHDILHFMDENLQTDVIFLDFSKAFDRVPKNLLLSKLCNLRIPPNFPAKN